MSEPGGKTRCQCGGELRVSNARQAASAYRRRMRCTSCKNSFTTYEVRVDAGAQVLLRRTGSGLEVYDLRQTINEVQRAREEAVHAGPERPDEDVEISQAEAVRSTPVAPGHFQGCATQGCSSTRCALSEDPLP